MRVLFIQLRLDLGDIPLAGHRQQCIGQLVRARQRHHARASRSPIEIHGDQFIGVVGLRARHDDDPLGTLRTGHLGLVL